MGKESSSRRKSSIEPVSDRDNSRLSSNKPNTAGGGSIRHKYNGSGVEDYFDVTEKKKSILNNQLTQASMEFTPIRMTERSRQQRHAQASSA